LKFGILNSVRRINKNFERRFGRIVLATDNANYWRKSAFKYYKANRKKDRDDSGIDWPLVFEILDTLRTELKENFPYKIMDVPGAEADDVIGVIAKHFHDEEKILIVSGDHDFMQLQRYPNVHQYGPVQDKLLITTDPDKFLFEHILHGDKGDGVPNFLSADDSLVNGVKQKSIYQAKVDVWYGQPIETFCTDETMKSNYYRNKKLVDLSEIPAEVEAAILAEFATPVIGSSDMIYSYLVKNRMKNLLESIREF
jgi:5'-3' exonuclease